MNNISNFNGLNLSDTSVEDLELLLKNELYMDIDSPFAVEIMTELDNRFAIVE